MINIIRVKIYKSSLQCTGICVLSINFFCVQKLVHVESLFPSAISLQLIQTEITLFVCLFICLFYPSPIHSFMHVQLYVCVCAFVHSFIHSFFRLFVRLFVCSCTCCVII